MGFTQKTAEKFFSLISENEIEIVIDIRLNNNTQLAGFTKGKDLAFFLSKISNCSYAHETIFAPERELLNNYKKGIIIWQDYETIYRELYLKRNMKDYFIRNYNAHQNVLLLCSESTPEHCHRRLLANFFKEDVENINIIHL